MTPEQRILNTIERKKSDCLPIVFGFSNDETKRKYAEAFNMSYEEFSEYVGSNEIQPLFVIDDIYCFLKNKQLTEFAFENGFAFPDKGKNIVYDRWGVGWELTGGYGQRPVVHSLDNLKTLRSFQPPDIKTPGMFYHVEQQLSNLKRAGSATISHDI